MIELAYVVVIVIAVLVAIFLAVMINGDDE